MTGYRTAPSPAGDWTSLGTSERRRGPGRPSKGKPEVVLPVDKSVGGPSPPLRSLGSVCPGR